MKVEYWMTGITSESFVKEGIDFYYKRIKHVLPLNLREIKVAKGKSQIHSMELERDAVFKDLKSGDYLILLDEKGEMMTSTDFAGSLEKLLVINVTRIIFLSGGPYGFNPELKSKANLLLSISKMTTTHELCRVFFLEQLYRALTIIKNHPYHH
jgi:23S rRNA (pseudouridine1915-N3)-methyltransferase